jgi:hypothetical protein
MIKIRTARYGDSDVQIYQIHNDLAPESIVLYRHQNWSKLTAIINSGYLTFFQKLLELEGIAEVSFERKKNKHDLILLKGHVFPWNELNPQVEALLCAFKIGIPEYDVVPLFGSREKKLEITENSHRVTFHVDKEICRTGMQIYFKINWKNLSSYRTLMTLGEAGYELVSKIFALTEVEEILISAYKLTIISEKDFASDTMEKVQKIVEETLTCPTSMQITSEQLKPRMQNKIKIK